MTLAVGDPVQGQSSRDIDDPVAGSISSAQPSSASGRIQIHATRLESPLQLNGLLDEEVYRTVPPTSGFLQQYPVSGSPATEETEVWVFYDSSNIYVSIRAYDSRADRIVANEMRRDNRNIWLNDNVIVVFDTFLDRRSAFFFQTNPLGGVRDGLVIDENSVNYDWNTVWDVRSRRNEGGWTVEMAIPFRSLRYRAGASQTWGFNLQRVVRSKNEFTLLSPPPGTYNDTGVFRLASAAEVTGIEVPEGSRNIHLRPYGISRVTTNVPGGVAREVDADFGLDFRYGLTNSLALDLTYNTDFAQVEIDEQQVNLTRFSLAFPEKRDFFLEGQGIFDFGGSSGGRASNSPAPNVFFSRRIGLEDGRPVPIDGGGRLMGRAGPVSMGFLGTRVGGAEVGAGATHFSVARVKSDVFRRGSAGMIVTYRDPSSLEGGTNLVYGADGNLAVFEHIRLSGYYARSREEGTREDPESYRARAQYDSDRYGVVAEQMKAGRDFRPGVGFLRREDFRRTFVLARFSPRLASSPHFRRWAAEANVERYVNSRNEVETQQEQGSFRLELHRGDNFSADVFRNLEVVARPFRVAEGLVVPPGSYRFYEGAVGVQLGPQRRVGGAFALRAGGFHTGDRVSLSYAGRAEASPRFSIEPRMSVDWIWLPDASARVTLWGARPTWTMTPRMYASALMQYNSSTGGLESNLRWRWEFQPGSDLFVVYTDGRGGSGVSPLELNNRGVAIKFTRFLRF